MSAARGRGPDWRTSGSERSLRRGVLASVTSRRRARHGPEDAREVALVGESEIGRDVGAPTVRRGEKLAGAVDAEAG